MGKGSEEGEDESRVDCKKGFHFKIVADKKGECLWMLWMGVF